MAALTASEVITNAYYLLEKGADPWVSGDDEFTTAQKLGDAAINRWEFYDNTRWKELWVTLDDAASSVTKTITAGTYDYTAPTDMRYPSSYVRTSDSGGSSSYWQVIPSEKSAVYDESSARVCWFTGSEKAGFTLHFNPNITLTTGDTIHYEYYKQATKFTATTSTTEMADPYFISYFIAAHMAEDGVDPDYNNMAEARLEQMRVVNMSQLYGVSDNIPSSIEFGDGFGV
jgi:hypothetical protein